MSNYSIITNFAAKDTLASGNPLKLVKGVDFTNEYTAVQTALNTKIDGTVQFFPDGTASQPSVGFASTAGVGVFQVSGTLQLATGGVPRLAIGTSGAIAINTSSGQALTITGAAGSYATQVTGGATSGTSFGLYIKAGTTSADNALEVQLASTTQAFNIRGDGQSFAAFQANFAAGVAISAGGLTITGGSLQVTNQSVGIIAPASGQALSVNNSTNSAQLFIVNSAGLVQVVNGLAVGGNIFSNIGNSGVSISGDTSTNSLDGGYLQCFSPGFGSAPGQTIIGAGGANRLAVSNVGAVSIFAPTSAQALTVAGAAGSYTTAINAPNAANNSYGLLVTAGTSSTDHALTILNATSATTYFDVRGDGLVTIAGNPVYSGVPTRTVTTGYTTVLTDGGQGVSTTNGGTINIGTSHPAGATVSFYVGAGVAFTIASSQTLVWTPSGATGNRTITGAGVATAWQVVAGTWLLSGTGLS